MEAKRYPCRACSQPIMLQPDTLCGDCIDFYNPRKN